MYELRSTLLPSILILFSLLLLSCSVTDRLTAVEHERLEAQCADDLVALGEEAAAMGIGTGLSVLSRWNWSECIAGYAGCERCYEIDGDSMGGTLAMSLQGTPCMASFTINEVSLAYTIYERHWAGTWISLDGGWYDLAWEGSHSSSLVMQGVGDLDGEYDASFQLNRATAQVDGQGGVRFWTASYQYSGYLGRNWHLSVVRSEEGQLSGEVTSDTGIVCGVSGQDYDLSLECSY